MGGDSVTTFFSVDVETSGTSPLKGDLLTIGAVAVQHDGDQWTPTQQFYIRLDYGPGGMNANWDESTQTWWEDQDDDVRGEAYEDSSLCRVSPHAAMKLFEEWVLRVADTDEVHERVFAANPASFDYNWIDASFTTTNVKNPFSHRTMCLRSLAFGQSTAAAAMWKEYRPRWNKPLRPHHALDDALAQAWDLCIILEGKES